MTSSEACHFIICPLQRHFHPGCYSMLVLKYITTFSYKTLCFCSISFLLLLLARLLSLHFAAIAALTECSLLLCRPNCPCWKVKITRLFYCNFCNKVSCFLFFRCWFCCFLSYPFPVFPNCMHIWFLFSFWGLGVMPKAGSISWCKRESGLGFSFFLNLISRYCYPFFFFWLGFFDFLFFIFCILRGF